MTGAGRPVFITLTNWQVLEGTMAVAMTGLGVSLAIS
jgi:hypothetical protein